MKLAAAFAGVCQAVVQQGFVDAGGWAVFLEDPQPGQIVLVAFFVLHRKFECDLPADEHGGAVDVVRCQQAFVGDLWHNVDRASGVFALGRNQFTAGAAQGGAGLFQSDQLFF